jgi:hypothetical protein
VPQIEHQQGFKRKCWTQGNKQMVFFEEEKEYRQIVRKLPKQADIEMKQYIKWIFAVISFTTPRSGQSRFASTSA